MNSTKNFIISLLVVISGLVIGGFIGNLLGGVSFLSWLNYGKTIGLTSPLVLDLEIIHLTFAFSVKFSICGIIGMVAAALIYKKFR